MGQLTLRKLRGEKIPAEACWEIQSHRNVELWRRLSLVLSSLIPILPFCVPSFFKRAHHPISENHLMFGANVPLPVEECVAKRVELSEGLFRVDH